MKLNASAAFHDQIQPRSQAHTHRFLGLGTRLNQILHVAVEKVQASSMTDQGFFVLGGGGGGF